jgi:hypothetical protein
MPTLEYIQNITAKKEYENKKIKVKVTDEINNFITNELFVYGYGCSRGDYSQASLYLTEDVDKSLSCEKLSEKLKYDREKSTEFEGYKGGEFFFWYRDDIAIGEDNSRDIIDIAYFNPTPIITEDSLIFEVLLRNRHNLGCVDNWYLSNFISYRGKDKEQLRNDLIEISKKIIIT